MKRLFGLGIALVIAACGGDDPAGPPPPPPPPPPPAADIAFSMGTNIWVAQADGAGVLQLTTSSQSDTQPNFDATGTVVYFVRFTPGASDGEIWRVNVDGTGESQVTTLGGIGLIDFHPTAGVITRGGIGGISTVDLAGTAEVQVTTPTGGASDQSPVWSPDGTEITFNRVLAPTSEVWIVSADGTNGRMVASSNSPSISASTWHPSGTRVAAILHKTVAPPLDFNVYDVQVDGSGEAQLTTSGLAWIPKWSPDGSKFLFREGGAAADQFIAVANADGSGQISVGDGGGGQWSRDGTLIAYCQRTAGAESGLVVVAPDGSGEVTIDANAVCFGGGFSWAR